MEDFFGYVLKGEVQPDTTGRRIMANHLAKSFEDDGLEDMRIARNRAHAALRRERHGGVVNSIDDLDCIPQTCTQIRRHNQDYGFLETYSANDRDFRHRLRNNLINERDLEFDSSEEDIDVGESDSEDESKVPKNSIEYRVPLLSPRIDEFNHTESWNQTIIHRCSNLRSTTLDGTEEKIRDSFSELIVSEKRYLSKLKKLRFHFKQRLLIIISGDVSGYESFSITMKDLNSIFGNLEQLIDMSKMLLDILKEDCNRLNDLILDFVEKAIPVFVDYCVNYDYAQRLAKSYLREKDFARVIRLEESLLQMKLLNVLFEPVQRVTRYIFLVKNWVKEMKEKTGVDCLHDITQAFEKLAISIEDEVVKDASFHMVAVFQKNLFKSSLSLFNGRRFCIRYSYISLIQKPALARLKGLQKMTCLMILFSDNLMVCRKGKLKYVLPLFAMQIDDLGTVKDIDNCFRIVSTHKVIVVSAVSRQLLKEWTDDIRTAVQVTQRRCAEGERAYMRDELEQIIRFPSSQNYSRFIFPNERYW